MKIGIFGGSFNPIHFGHLRLSQWIVRAGYVDKVWLMVSPQNPWKVQHELMPEHFRFEIAQRACCEFEGVEASNFEFDLERPTYTWRTLDALRHAYPEHDFSLIIGEDNWLLFEKWAHYEDILTSTELLVYPRGNETLEGPVHLLDRAKSVVIMHGAPLLPFSSTEVRWRLKHGELVTSMVPEVVEECLKRELAMC